MKTEKEKMMAGEPYDAHCEEMIAIRTEVKHILHRLNVTEYYTDKFKDTMRELCPNSADDVHFEPPFYCDYGTNIFAAEGVFINFGATILDGAKVTIGRKTLIAPGVHIYTAQHPLEIKSAAYGKTANPSPSARNVGSAATPPSAPESPSATALSSVQDL